MGPKTSLPDNISKKNLKKISEDFGGFISCGPISSRGLEPRRATRRRSRQITSIEVIRKQQQYIHNISFLHLSCQDLTISFVIPQLFND